MDVSLLTDFKISHTLGESVSKHIFYKEWYASVCVYSLNPQE